MHSCSPLRTLILATLLLLVLTGSLNATLMQYSDRATWEATTPGATNIDFDVTSTFASYSNATGLNLGGVQFLGLATPPSYQLFVVDPAFAPDHDHGSGDVLKGPEYEIAVPTKSIVANLPGGITSFGVDLMTYDAVGGPAPPQTFNILLSTLDPVTPVMTLTQPGRAFLGIVSSDPISQVEFVLATGINAQTFPLIDNFSFGTASPAATPEPSTYLLVGGGLLMVAAVRRRKLWRS